MPNFELHYRAVNILFVISLLPILFISLCDKISKDKQELFIKAMKACNMHNKGDK